MATVNYNGNTGAVGDERHGLRDLSWHAWAHHTIGTRYESGLDMVSPNAGVDNQLSFGGGTIHDEDIDNDSAATTLGRLWFNTSASAFSWEDFVDNAGADYPYKWNPATSQVQYRRDDFTWQDVPDNDYVVYYYYGSNDIYRNIYVYTPPLATAYPRASDARKAIAAPAFSAEIKLLYQVIFNGNGQFVESTDYRTSSAVPGGGTPSTTASAVSFTPTGDIAATTVQAAITELDAEKAPAIYPITPLGTLTATATLDMASKAEAHFTATLPEDTVPTVTFSLANVPAGATGVVLDLTTGLTFPNLVFTGTTPAPAIDVVSSVYRLIFTPHPNGTGYWLQSAEAL